MSTTANATYGHKEHNYTMLQAFEWYVDGDGKHLSKVKSELPRLDHMGITAMWLPPPTKPSSTNSVGYDVYDIWDLGEFDQKGARGTKFGSKEELVDTIKTAKDKFGIITYIDAVLNHKFGADHTERFKAVEVASDDRTRNVSDPYDIEGWTAFDFTGRGGKYSDFKWNFNHFTGVDYNAENGKKAIYKILGDNKGWAFAVDSENKNYDYLMGADIDHAHPDVQKDLFNWGNWVLQETGAFGFRFDAIKHIDENFMREFVKHVRAGDGHSQVFCVGEFWKDSLTDLEAYLGRFSEQFSVFDTPLHYNFKQASDEGDRFDLRSIWDDSLVKNMPVDAVTIVDNHDTQIGQALESWVAAWFKPLAYALILLRSEGYPCVFWGDLYGCGGNSPQQPVTQLADIIRSRKCFAYGETRDYWDYMNCVGWVRTGDAQHDGCAVILCNGDDPGTKWMEVGKEHAGEKWTDILGWTQGEITINQDGWAEFRCSARSIGIWVKEGARGRKGFKGGKFSS